MAQIRQDFVNVTNGASYIDSTNALTDWSTVAPGHLFTIVGDGVFYTIAAVLLPGPVGVPRLNLTAPYAGVTGTAKNYAITTDFTPNLNLPLINRGDIETGELYSIAMAKVDEIQAGAGVTKTYVDEADANLQTQIDANADAIVDLVPNKIALGDIQVPDNALQNADMWYWQRGLNVDRVINGTNLRLFGPDRFKLYTDGTWNIKIRNLDDSNLAFTGYPRQNRLARITAVGSHGTLASSEDVLVRYVMEGYDFARIDGLPSVYTMWVYTNRTGTMYMSVRLIVANTDATYSQYLQDFLINPNAGTQVQLFFPARTGNLAKKKSDDALYLDIVLAAATNVQGPPSSSWGAGSIATTRQTNFLDVAGNVVDIWGPCLRTGSIAVPHRVSSAGSNELSRLQRYCVKNQPQDTVPGTSGATGVIRAHLTSGTVAHFGHRYPGGEMRAVPTVTAWAENGTANSITTQSGVIGINVLQRDAVGIGYMTLLSSQSGGQGTFHYLADADF